MFHPPGNCRKDFSRPPGILKLSCRLIPKLTPNCVPLPGKLPKKFSQHPGSLKFPQFFSSRPMAAPQNINNLLVINYLFIVYFPRISRCRGKIFIIYLFPAAAENIFYLFIISFPRTPPPHGSPLMAAPQILIIY